MTTAREQERRQSSLSYLTSSRHQHRRRLEFINRSRTARSEALSKARGIVEGAPAQVCPCSHAVARLSARLHSTPHGQFDMSLGLGNGRNDRRFQSRLMSTAQTAARGSAEYSMNWALDCTGWQRRWTALPMH